MIEKLPFIEKNIVFTLLLFAFFGIHFPNYFIWANNILFILLSLIAFCVGLNLKPNHFKNVWSNKKLIIPVLMFKYTLVPITTYLICILLKVPTLYTVSLVILTCCPAANTGNIMCYLSKGNTAMIVITTIIGALLAPIITPTIIYLLLHKVVQIKFIDILRVITTGITIPMIFGILISHYLPRIISPLKKSIPSIGILSVSIIIAAVLSNHVDKIMEIEASLLFLCTMLIVTFLCMGFWFSKSIKCKLENAIAMSFEIGTFDGVLGILLTLQIAGNNAVFPVVLFAVLNLILGSIATKIFTSNKFLELAK